MARLTFLHRSGIRYYRCSTMHQWREWPAYMEELHRHSVDIGLGKMRVWYRENIDEVLGGHMHLTASAPMVMIDLSKIFGLKPKMRWEHDCEHCIPLVAVREYDVYVCNMRVHKGGGYRVYDRHDDMLLLAHRRANAPGYPARTVPMRDFIVQTHTHSLNKALKSSIAVAWKIREIIKAKWPESVLQIDVTPGGYYDNLNSSVRHPMYMHDDYGWVCTYDSKEYRSGNTVILQSTPQGENPWYRLTHNKAAPVAALDGIPADANDPDPPERELELPPEPEERF